MRMLIQATSLLCLLFLAPILPAQTQVDPLVGVWTLNVAKSSYEPGLAPQRVTLTYRRKANGYEWFSDGIDAKGNPTHAGGAIVFDGKYRAVTGNPNWDELAFKPVDAFNTQVIRRKGGKVVQTGLRVLSLDGTTLTVSADGVDATGRIIHEVQVYEKQR
jgi:hypothetical protein